MSSSQPIEGRLESLDRRIQQAWPRRCNARADLMQASLSEAAALINGIDGQAPEVQQATLATAERLVRLAENLGRHDQAMILLARSLFQQVGRLWSAVAENFPPDRLNQVVAMDERLHEHRDLVESQPLLALAKLSSRLADITRLAEECNVVIEAALRQPPPAELFADLPDPESLFPETEEELFGLAQAASSPDDSVLSQPDDGMPISLGLPSAA